jgi:hypothetical protein
LIEGNEVIDKQERLAIFVFTAVTYLSGIFSLWYALRPKRKLVQDFAVSKIPNSLPIASENKKETSAPKESDSDITEEKESESISEDKTIESSDDAGKEEIENEGSDNNKGNIEDNALEKAVEVANESGEQIENDTDGLVNPEQTNEEVEPQSVEESSESVQAPSPTDEEELLPNESEKEGEDVGKLDDSSSSEASIPKMNETEEPKAV